MDKNKLLNMISDDCETELLLLGELQKQLDEELSKPLKLRDFDKIDMLTQSVRELTESTEAAEIRDENGKQYIREKAEKKAKSSASLRRFAGIGAALCCVAIVVGVNAYSLSTLGMSFFSAVVQFSKSGVSLDFSTPDNVPSDVGTGTEDKFGIKEKCAEYGVSCAAPEYIPDDYVLSDYFCEELSDSTACSFYFTSGEHRLNLTIEKHISADSIPPMLIPNEEHALEEVLINGNMVYLLNENNCYTAVYSSGDTVYLLYTDGLDYDEFEKIIVSMK